MSDQSPAIVSTADREAAHEFLSELRTRITTQPLPYQHGVESRALESLWEVFGHARDAMKRHPGCRRFAELVTRALNLDVRPVTAKWHRAHADGLLRSRDGADRFRADLAGAQAALRNLSVQLHAMAYGEPGEDVLTPPPMSAAEIESLFAPVTFGIADSLIPADTAASLNKTERDAVAARRARWRITTAPTTNAVGLALSGGGIRSATFSLGVVQVLAERHLLRDVDFLSTVSGGGYTGSFLSSRLGAEEPLSDVAGPYGPDPDPVRHLRQYTKFLGAADMKQRWSMVVSTLAGLLLNWSAPLVVIALSALAATMADRYLGPMPWRPVASVLAIVTTAGLLVYGLRLRLHPGSATSAVVALPAAVTALVAAAWAVDAGYDRVSASTGWWWPSSALVASLVAAGPTVLRVMPVVRRPAVRKALLQGLLLVAAVTTPLLAIAVFYALRLIGATSLATLAAVTIGVGIAASVLNINLTGFHRLYRDGLARTFVRSEEGATLALADVNPKGSAPYHLINTTLNVSTSRNPVLRERRSDFFLFSKGWCGSPATGYMPTSEWRMSGARPDLATAMAISGAAVSPHMGLGSKPGLRALMALFNARLGFWIKRPDVASPYTVPGFLCLLREMTGVAMDEARPWLFLSDGGHIENLGAYELLRRRCKFVICVDGEADPAFGFHGLMTLVRHVQIDFGARMEPVLTDLRPNADTGCCQTHASLFRVHYTEGETGLFLYLKLSVTGNEPELLRRYRLTHPEFPHQTTLDQFFDEEQFEAYRQLGVHVADGLFAPAVIGDGVPTSVPDWFRRLATNLLLPA